ncbi:hypothetical protein V2G26_016754 [Clonostachys chloroleuca]
MVPGGANGPCDFPSPIFFLRETCRPGLVLPRCSSGYAALGRKIERCSRASHQSIHREKRPLSSSDGQDEMALCGRLCVLRQRSRNRIGRSSQSPTKAKLPGPG